MIDLFYQGGTLFMSILTLLLAGVVFSAFKFQDWTKDIGMVALAVGVLGQVIGLYEGFAMMEQVADQINPSILAGGLKVSSITTMYGLLIYIIALIIHIITKPRIS